MPAWSWWAPIRCGARHRVFEFGADASDDDRSIARPHAGRAEDDDAVAHARVVGMDRRIAVLQGVAERASAAWGCVGGGGGRPPAPPPAGAAPARRPFFVFVGGGGARRTVHSRK